MPYKKLLYCDKSDLLLNNLLNASEKVYQKKNTPKKKSPTKSINVLAMKNSETKSDNVTCLSSNILKTTEWSTAETKTIR